MRPIESKNGYDQRALLTWDGLDSSVRGQYLKLPIETSPLDSVNKTLRST